nr:retrovirus-related Pol polyprotein from transposon TNT 1-94 [Tanacetum cinerariifolium]
MILYNAYKNPQGIIYQDKFQRNRLMRLDELYKFYDGTLSSFRMVLHDIASRLEMNYLPKRHWSNLEKKRSHIMIKNRRDVPKDIPLDSIVVLRNKSDLDTMSIDDLYNNFKIVEQEVKKTTSSNSSSQNMAFMSSTSHTNKVNTAYGVSTTNTQVNTASTANLSDANVYAFLASQPNGSQLAHEDLVQIHEDDLKEMDLKWHYMAKDEAPTNMALIDFLDSEGVKYLITVKKGLGYESYHVVLPPSTGLFLPPKLDFSNSGLEEFKQLEFESYRPKTSNSVSEDISTEVKESYDVPLVKKLVSDDKLEKKTVVPTDAKIEFVRAKQQEKPVKYAEMYRPQGPSRNQRNWNNLKLTAITIKGEGWPVNTASPRPVNTIRPRLVNTLRPRPVNTARPNSAVVNAVKVQEDQGYVGSKCSRHMIGNMSYLSNFKEFDEGYVTFRGRAKGGRITSKGTLKTASKDETLGILKKFITEIENLVDKKVKNRVLVVKPHNKTLYELFRGRTHALSFMRPYGCHVTIFNTLDHLGKFDGKSDDGFFFGYSLNSKDFKVYNLRTRKVEENLRIRFLEDKPSSAGTNSNDFADGSLSDSSLRNASNDEPQPFSATGHKDDEVDLSNISNTYLVSSAPNTRIHKDHSLDHVIGDVQSGVLTRRMTKTTNEQGFISAGKKASGTKSIFKNKKDERGIVIKNKARIKDEVYVCQPPGFKDLDHPDMVYKVVKALYGLYQALKTWYETLAKYILADSHGYENLTLKLTFYKAFFSPQWEFLIHIILQCLSAKTTALNEFSSTMASVIICLATNLKFIFSKYIFYHMVKNLEDGVKFLMFPRFVQVFLDSQVEGMLNHKEIYVTPSHTKKIFANMKIQGNDIFGKVIPLFESMMVQPQEDMDEHMTATSNDPILSANQALEIKSLKRRVKKLVKIASKKTHKLKRLYKTGSSTRVESSEDTGLGDQEDASKQGRMIDDLDVDERVALVDETQERND